MAEKRIEGDEIINPEWSKDATNSADAFLAKINQIIAGIKTLAIQTGKRIPLADPKTLAEAEKLNDDLRKLLELEKGITEAKRVKVQVQELEKKQAREIRDQLKSQGGILGDLIIKQKALKEGLLTAKTKDEIKKINEELFKTSGQIKNIKEGGTSAFNSWGNALQSFQFKFNSLGQMFGQMAATGLLGLVSVIADFGGQLLAGAKDWAENMGFFGESVRVAKENSAALEGELKAVEERLASISKGVDVQFSAAFDSVIKTIDIKLAKTKQTLADFNPGLRGLSGEDLEKAKEERKKIEDEISALIIERRIAVEQQYRDSIRRQVDTAKNGNIERINDEIQALGKERSINKERFSDQELNLQEFQSRETFIRAQIETLEEESSKSQDKRRDEKLKKDKEALDKALEAKQKSLEKEFKAFTDFWDKEDKKEADRLKAGEKAWDDFVKDLEKINEDALAQRKKDEADALHEIQEERRDAFDKELKYEIDALEGQFGKAEQVIAKQEIETKIALGTASFKEIAAYNKFVKEQREKRVAEEIGALNKVADAAFDTMAKVNDQKKKDNEEELSENEMMIQLQADRANQGLSNTLDWEMKERARILKEKAELDKQARKQKEAQELAEVFIEFLKVYAGEKPPSAASQKAFAATMAGKAIAKSFGSFYVGTEDTGGPGSVDSKGGKFAILHPHEGVVNAAGKAQVPGLVTAVNEAGFLGAKDWAMKHIFPEVAIADRSMKDQVNSALNNMLVKEIKGLRQDLKNKADLQFKRGVMNELITIQTENGRTTETTHFPSTVKNKHPLGN